MASDQLSNRGTDGTVLGQSAADLIGFHGATASDQRALLTAISTTTTQTAKFGFKTTAQPRLLIAAVNEIIALLKEKGLMASA